jgi:ABC-type nitrate/sulfonate/bicarbonate transport system ATPase subunit
MCACASAKAGAQEYSAVSAAREHERKPVVFVTHSTSKAVFLADRIVVMATQPGLIKQIIDVPLRHRRDRSDHEFVGLERRIKDAVRGEVIKLGVV